MAVPVYSSPTNVKGWIPEADTAPLTRENLHLVQSDLHLKAGTKVYEVFGFDKIASTAPTILDGDVRGRLEERRGGYARLELPGALDLWVEEKYLVYPPLD